MSLLSLVHASRSYPMAPGPLHALADISLQLDAGDYLAVAGPSGSGKSTLLNVLALLDPLTAGQHWWRGVRIDGADEDSRLQARDGQVGYIFQRCHLIERHSVADNVGLGLGQRRLAAAERQRAIVALLERFGLAHCVAWRPSQLSLGQQQCVAICRAVIAQPALLLADEPCAHLDPQQTAQAMRLLQTLHDGGVTIVLASQHAAIAAHATRTLQLAAGRIVADAQYRS